MAPGTVHTSPAAAQDLGNRGGTPAGSVCVWGHTTFSRLLSAWGGAQASLYPPNKACWLPKREMGRTSHSSSTTWRWRLELEPRFGGGGLGICSGSGCKEERGRRAPSARLHRPPPPHPSQGFRSGTSPPRLLAPAPFSVFIPNPKKTATSQPARPAREPTVKTPVLWPCPCPRDPTRGAGSAPHPPRTARSSASGSFASSAWTLCGNLEPPKIRH